MFEPRPRPAPRPHRQVVGARRASPLVDGRNSGRRMRRPYAGSRAGLCLLVLLAACAPTSDAPAAGTLDASGALLPDTSTANGVLQLRHHAAALETVTTLTLDSAPLATFDDPSGTWEMSRISNWYGFADGRMVGSSLIGNPGLLLFGNDGVPERLLARNGQGPGEVGPQVWGQMFMVHDTLVVFDPTNQRISRYTANGFVDDRPWLASFTADCNRPIGHLAAVDRMLVQCRAPGAAIDAESPRPMLAIGVGNPGDARVVHSYPGLERRRVLGQTTAGMEMIWETLAFGRTTQVVGWDSVIVVASQDRGFVLELRDSTGALRREIVVERSAQAVTQAMRDTLMARQVVAAIRNGAHGGYREGELERKARAQPFPDSLPPHGILQLGYDGTLWVFDYLTEADTTWSAIGFRADGAIVGRLSGRGGKYHRPFWFGRGTVLMRQEDEDGLVRFRMYRIVNR